LVVCTFNKVTTEAVAVRDFESVEFNMFGEVISELLETPSEGAELTRTKAFQRSLNR
jgi:hypothetical protein